MSFVFGIIACAAAAVVFLLNNGNLSQFLDAKAGLFVVAGMVGIAFATNSFSNIADNVKTILRVLMSNSKPGALYNKILDIAQTARKDGILSLENLEKSVDDAILKKGLILLSGSADRDTIESILRSDAAFTGEKEKRSQEFLERLSILAQVTGMIGTLVEIVQMLYTYKSPQIFAPVMARSLLPAVYGALTAYLLLVPLQYRVRSGSEKLGVLRELSINGVLSIHSGEPPFIAKERLKIYLGGKSVQDRGDGHGRSSFAKPDR